MQMHPDLLSVLVDGLGPDATLAAPDGTGSVSTIGTPLRLPLRCARAGPASCAEEAQRLRMAA